MNEIHYRHELKYPVSLTQMAVLQSRIQSLMQLDPNAGRSGKYIVRSLYFDSLNSRCYYDNENGTEPREKFRIRTYNYSPQKIDC